MSYAFKKEGSVQTGWVQNNEEFAGTKINNL